MGEKILPFKSPPCPLHPNCRCIKLPITKTFEEMGLDIEDIEEAARAYTIRPDKPIARGGRKILEVGRIKGNYSDFYDSRGPIFRKNLVGPGRANLIDSGVIDLKDLVDIQTGRLFTIKELENDFGLSYLKYNELTTQQKNIISQMKVHYLDKNKLPKESSKVYKLWMELDEEYQNIMLDKWKSTGTFIPDDMPLKSKMISLKTEVKQVKIVQSSDELKKTLNAKSVDVLEKAGGYTESELKQTLNVVNETISKISDEHPAIKQILDENKVTIKLHDGILKNSNGTPAMGVKSKDGIITLSKLDSTTDDILMGDGVFSVSSDLNGALKHELSHHIFEGLSVDDMVKFDELFEKFGQEYFSKNISIYAGTDVYEAFAECSTIYLSDLYGISDLKFPNKEIENFFIKIYGEKKSAKSIIKDIPKAVVKEVTGKVVDDGMLFSELTLPEKNHISQLKTNYLKKDKLPKENSPVMKTWMSLKPSEQKNILDDFVTKGWNVHPDLPVKQIVIKETKEEAEKVAAKALKESLKNPNEVNVFVKDMELPKGVFEAVDEKSLKYETKKMELGPIKVKEGNHQAAGVIAIDETGEKVWIYEPTNHFGGYEHTFSKGTIESGMTIQKTAIKEAFEETGLQVKIIGHLDDYEKTTSTTRYYIGKVTGGDPTKAGWEAQSVKLVKLEDSKKFLNTSIDQKIADDLIEKVNSAKKLGEGNIEKGLDKIYQIELNTKKIAAEKEVLKQAKEEVVEKTVKQVGVSVSKLDDVFDPLKILTGKVVDDGMLFSELTLPEKNHISQLKTNYLKKDKLPKENSPVMKTWMSLKPSEQENILEDFVKKGGVVHPDLKVNKGVSNMFSKPMPVKSSTELPDVLKIDDYIKYGEQKGSNLGGFYSHKNNPADRWYMKFPEEEIARNEVLASKLYEAAGVDVPTLKFVSKEGKLGIASRIEDGVEQSQKLLTTGKVAGVNDNFVVDAWMANHDVIGLDYDNLLVKNGSKAIRIDVGGSLKYRAMGGTKGNTFGKVVDEIETLRNSSINSRSASVFKNITKEELEIGARKVLSVDDKTITKLVREFGPISKKEQDELIEIMIERKKDIAKRFPNAVVSTKVDEINPKWITEFEHKKIINARGNGYVIRSDKDMIEDHSVFYWVEKDVKGNDVLSASFKLRGDITRKINEIVKGNGVVDVDINTDELLEKTRTALRGIGKNSRENTPIRSLDITRSNAAIKEWEGVVKKLVDLYGEKKITKDEFNMVMDHYKPHIGYIKEVLQKGEGAIYKLKDDVSGYPSLTEAVSIFKASKKDSVFVFEEKDFNFMRKSITNGNLKQTKDAFVFIEPDKYDYMLYDMDRKFYEAEHEGIKIRYYLDDDRTPFAVRGQFEISVNGNKIEDINKIKDVLKEFKIDIEKSSYLDQEELYLHQILNVRNDDKSRDIIEAARNIIGQEEKIAFMKRELNREVGFDITKSKYYNPEGVRQAFDEGRLSNMRPDFDDDEFDLFSKEYSLHHNPYNGVLSDLDIILNSGGQMISTFDKLRRGVKPRGMSPVRDMKTGGATYTFTRIWNEDRSYRTPGFVWDIKTIRRTDSISYDSDKFGQCSGNFVNENRQSNIKQFKYASHVPDNETIFKYSLSIFDGLKNIVVNKYEFDETVNVLKKHLKSDFFPDGRKITDVVIVKRY